MSLLFLMTPLPWTASGCWLVHTGIESGDDRVLKFINKPLSVADIRRQVEMIYRNGIMVRGYFILGLPTETRESMERTMALARQLPLYAALFSLDEVIPGSPLATTAAAYGAISPANQFQTGRVAATDEPPFLPEGISVAELKRAELSAVGQFYQQPRRMIMHLRRASPGSMRAYGRLLALYLRARIARGRGAVRPG